jgi:hypothetical protein
VPQHHCCRRNGPAAVVATHPGLVPTDYDATEGGSA